MTNVKRYLVLSDGEGYAGVEITEDPDGPWVDFDDHQAIADDNSQLRKMIIKLTAELLNRNKDDQTISTNEPSSCTTPE